MLLTVTATGSVWAVSPNCTTARTASCSRASTVASPRDATTHGGPTTARGSSWPVRSPGSHLLFQLFHRTASLWRCFTTVPPKLVVFYLASHFCFTALTPCWEADSCLKPQEIPRLLRDLEELFSCASLSSSQPHKPFYNKSHLPIITF